MANTGPAQNIAKLARKTIVGDFDGLLETGQFADLVIVCKEREWKVHKAIVCPQSMYFMRACTGGFAEAELGRIDLSCDDEDVLDTLITYLYYGEPTFNSWDFEDVDEEAQLSNITACEGPVHLLKVHVLADKYHVDRLASFAADRFMELVDNLKYCKDFAAWLIAVQEGTAPASSLRPKIYNLVLDNMEALLTVGGGKYAEAVTAFKAALVRCPEFAVSVMLPHVEALHAD
ncbi:hypothetical protein B0A48_13784 [Cryoendolithus antarcticus]|uniref:BTB domain-containing protein n=1 Tax=Cryoendolithus antarcticus TaxID=1507870 RepID=A0A1V8SMN8_9PEZI|nr:hypothetical protein B0A48_13784 [Cryoendolithus antarcticus]